MDFKGVLWINIVLFKLMLLVHLLRLIFGWQLIIGSWTVPLWASGVGVILAGTLAYLNWKHIKNEVMISPQGASKQKKR